MPDTPIAQFRRQGWLKFPFDPAIAAWAEAALPLALNSARDPELQSLWLRCGGTWFVGVNALQNEPNGSVNGVALQGAAIDFLGREITQAPITVDQAQVSICWRGYPQPMDGESPAAFRFRKNRDAAHVDGVHPQGAQKRRHVSEFHAYLLGLPLAESPAKAAPFVVWEGSHEVMRRGFQSVLQNVAPQDWPKVDLTEVYQTTRKKVFETCKRVEIPAKPGEAYAIHRLALHGMAPWDSSIPGPEQGRVIAYFRPEIQGDRRDWLEGL